MARALDVASVIAGEAVAGTPEERWNDMVNIASVIANRAAMLGVTPQDVIANTTEFNAYNRSLPPGVGQDLIDMANEAMNYVQANGPVNNASFYATPAAADNLPSGLNFETATTGHQYFSDPQNRAIGTAVGYRAPNEFGWAANPENVPTPDFAGLMGPAGDLGNSWTINGVAPALTPTVQTWSDMAAAKPIASPMGSVTAQASLSANPALSASTTIPSGIPSNAPAISQADVDRALANITGANRFDPAFTEGLMSPSNPVVPTAVETTSFTPGSTIAAPTMDIASSRFATPEKTSRIGAADFDMARFAPSIDPATNIASFTGPAPADLGSFPSAMSAQRTHFGTGVYSPEHMAMQEQVERQLAEMTAQPSMSVPTQTSAVVPSALATPNFSQALNPSLPSMSVPSIQTAFAGAQPSITAAERAIASITAPSSLSPAQIGGYQQAAQSMIDGGQLGLSGQKIVDLAGNLVATARQPSLAPALETVQVAEQPQVATVDGPTTTPAVTQQQQTMASTTRQTPQVAADTSQKSFKDSLMSKETLAGATLGGLALGPVGGFLGALLGQQIAANGGLPSGAPTSPGGFVGYGPSAVASVYGGAPAGSYATATDGSTVTSTGGGWTTRTTADGVTTSTSPWGGGAGWFGGDDDDSEAA